MSTLQLEAKSHLTAFGRKWWSRFLMSLLFNAPQEEVSIFFPSINTGFPPAKYRYYPTLRTTFYGIRTEFSTFYARYSRSGQNAHEIDRFKCIIFAEKENGRTESGIDMSTKGKIHAHLCCYAVRTLQRETLCDFSALIHERSKRREGKTTSTYLTWRENSRIWECFNWKLILSRCSKLL